MVVCARAVKKTKMNRVRNLIAGLAAIVLAVPAFAAPNLGPWHTTGPLKAKGFNDPLFPEQVVDLAAKDEKGQPVWSQHSEWTDGAVHKLTAPGSSSTYLYRVISTEKAMSLPVSFGSDDGIEVWLNGKKIHSKNVPRGVTPGQDPVTLSLVAGVNRLLVKVFNKGGHCGFYFGTAANPRATASLETQSPPAVTTQAVRMAIEDLCKSFPNQYKGDAFLKRLEALEKKPDEKALLGLQREALLANPLLDFDRVLFVKRADGVPADKKRPGRLLGLPQNWQSNASLPKTGYDNEIAVLSPVRTGGKVATLFKPKDLVYVGDVDLHFDADRMLFSMSGTNGWQLWEIKADGSGLRQLTPDFPKIDNFDGCYLPDGKILFNSTMNLHGVPCVGGGDKVANLCRMDADGKNVRMFTFDQDQNWYPRVLNDGRVLYTRWEYSDTPHYFTRLLMSMNPDGTGQLSLYGSNSYWPNSTFYARQIPGANSKFVAVISGHHGVARMGELVVFDLGKGRFEATGAAQKIPGYGKKVEPVIQDQLVNNSWPKFLHPYPLSEKYILVSSKPTAQSKWGIYLVDTFDNMICLLEEDGYAIFEPVPFRSRPKPQVLPDRVRPEMKEGTVILSDVYAGPGLKGVPRGTVKSLRLFSFHYGYWGMGGHINIGIDGPWDVHRILGTVPVYEDGSANFKVPANTPIAIQPLNERGEAVALMRSWFVTMPGENASCVGCHESVNSGPPAKPSLAMRRAPTDIKSWNGPARGFSFQREVQPVLDKYCVGCHDGKNATMPNFTANQPPYELNRKKGAYQFDASYVALMPYVRRPGPESDFHIQAPMEYHVSTSELFQMLRKGHHGVRLDADAWNRLVTWVDLNVPCWGTWGEHRRQTITEQHALRSEYRKQYAGITEDPEVYPAGAPAPKPIAFIKPAPVQRVTTTEVKAEGWPFDAAEAKRRQNSVGLPVELTIDVDGAPLLLTLVPAGEFVMGDAGEAPQTRVKIAKPFYIGKIEITNDQFHKFNPSHDSGYISHFNKDQNTRGEPADQARQPVIRVTWQQAQEFCAWLSQKTGKKFELPTEAQWEYACRAGTATAMNYGDVGADFSKVANLADKRLSELCKRDSPKWLPHIAAVNDGAIVTDNADRWLPNAWGLFGMHGNAAEWTRSLYLVYPYRDNDGRNSLAAGGERVVRGGSFYDRPPRARSAFRLAYPSWQRVFNVGFRVVCETDVAIRPSTQTVSR
jgi:formylglycine-generating enzyme required for sulfatase activity